MNWPIALLLVAVIAFVFDSLKVTTPVNLTAVGLAFFVGSFLVAAL